MADCGCGGGGGAATTTVPHTQARTGQRPSCPVEECGCDTCVRIRIVQYLPWLSAPDIAVGAHIPGGAMVIPELPEREPDLTPPWMWLWWEDGGGTGVEAPANRDEGHASSEKAYNPDTGETTGPAGAGASDDEAESDPGSTDYWERKKQHMDDQFATPRSSAASGDEAKAVKASTCWPLPVTASIWLLPLLRNVCQYDLGVSSRYPNGTWTSGTQLHFELPADYVATRSKKEMREYCIPEWEAARTISWSHVASMVQVGRQEKAEGLFWDNGEGFAHRALMYALVTLHSYAELPAKPDVFAEPSKIGPNLLIDIETKLFTVVMDLDEIGSWSAMVGSSIWAYLYGAATGIESMLDGGSGASWDWKVGTVDASLTIDAGTTTTSGGGVNLTMGASGGMVAFTWNNTIRLTHFKAVNAALADYHFWWAWRLYSYGMDTGDANALIMARLAAKAALSEICEIAALLLHEYTHIHGGLFEDQEVDGCSNCCHYLSHWTFLQRLLAKNALPFPMLWSSYTTAPGDVVDSIGNARAGRFDFSRTEGWSVEKTRGSVADSCAGTWKADHADLWTEEHRLVVGWDLAREAICWDTIGGLSSHDTANFPNG